MGDETEISDIPRRGRLERVMHWAVALCVTVALASGFVIADTSWNGVGLIGRDPLYLMHQLLGFLVLPAAVIWALAGHCGVWHRRGPLAWLLWLAHGALLLGFVATAALGWVASGLGRFGDAPLAVLLEPGFVGSRDPGLAVTLYALHKPLAYWTMCLLFLHVAGALFHGLVLRDGRLAAMLGAGGRAGRGPGRPD